MSGKKSFPVWYGQWLPALLARPDLTATTKVVGAALATHADNNTGECFPSQWRLAVECGYPPPPDDGGKHQAPKAVQNAISALKRIGAFKVRSGTGRKPSTYWLVLPEAWQPIGRTSVRPIERNGTHERATYKQGIGRTSVRCRDAAACDPASHGRATQPRMAPACHCRSWRRASNPNLAVVVVATLPGSKPGACRKPPAYGGVC
jgi:hypothetical protein